MTRPRTLATLLGVSAAGTVVVRHLLAGGRGRHEPGGIVIGDAAGYDRQAGLLLGSFYRGIADDVASVAEAGARILEVGCGPGHLAVRLAGEHGLDVTGVDLDPRMIEHAQANADRLPNDRRPSFVAADAAALPFADAVFDLVVSTLSMHHWSEPTAGLNEMARVLRPDGRTLLWDLRAGVVPFHRHVPDPAAQVEGSALRLVAAAPWRWPWRLQFVQRLELAPLAPGKPNPV